MEEIKMSDEKKFKIKIRLNALREDESTPDPEPTMNLGEAVQKWWDTTGKANLESYLNVTVKNVTYKSYLHSFSTGESVDKEAYD